MKPDMKKEAQRWLKQAELDYSDAKFSADNNRFHLGCFLSQQAAEKAVKGYLYGQGLEMPWGHSVADLCRMATEYDKEFKGHITDGALLDKYYIPTRYPNGLPGGIPSEAFDKDDALKAMSLAERIIEFIKKKLG